MGGREEISDGVSAPVVAGEGAIDPLWSPPMIHGGWEGEAADTMIQANLHVGHKVTRGQTQGSPPPDTPAI